MIIRHYLLLVKLCRLSKMCAITYLSWGFAPWSSQTHTKAHKPVVFQVFILELLKIMSSILQLTGTLPWLFKCDEEWLSHHISLFLQDFGMYVILFHRVVALTVEIVYFNSGLELQRCERCENSYCWWRLLQRSCWALYSSATIAISPFSFISRGTHFLSCLFWAMPLENPLFINIFHQFRIFLCICSLDLISSCQMTSLYFFAGHESVLTLNVIFLLFSVWWANQYSFLLAP